MSETSTAKTANEISLRQLFALLIITTVLWSANWIFLTIFVPDPAARGQFGDMFGGINALFTAFAFAGLAYTILLQRKELADQRQSQQDLLRQQQIFQEEQRQKQAVTLEVLETSRQSFLKENEKLRQEREFKSDRIFAENLLRAIRAEIEALGAIYAAGSGQALEGLPDDKFYDVKFVVTQNYFTVFEANAVNLGRIDGAISRQIISIYLLTKLLIEEFHINNLYLDKLVELETSVAAGDLQRFRRGQVHNRLVDQSKKLKKLHADLKERTDGLLRVLDASSIS